MLTPSSHHRFRHDHRRHYCHCPRLPLRRHPRPALDAGRHRQLPTDQKGLNRGILDVFCSCPMLRLTRLQTRVLLMPQPEELLEQQIVGGRARRPAKSIRCGAVEV